MMQTLQEMKDGIKKKKPAEGSLNSEEQGTCARFNLGKVLFSLVPLHLLCGAARVFVWGTRKYAPWNWAKGGAWSTPFNCLIRHLFKWWYFKEELDNESRLHHLDHAMCNLLFLLHYKDTYKDGDDRPSPVVTHFAKTEALENFNRLFSIEEPKK